MSKPHLGSGMLDFCVIGVSLAPEGPVDTAYDRAVVVGAVKEEALYVGAVKEGLEGERVAEDIGIDEPEVVVVLGEGVLDDAVLASTDSMPRLRGP